VPQCLRACASCHCEAIRLGSHVEQTPGLRSHKCDHPPLPECGHCHAAAGAPARSRHEDTIAPERSRPSRAAEAARDRLRRREEKGIGVHCDCVHSTERERVYTSPQRVARRAARGCVKRLEAAGGRSGDTRGARRAGRPVGAAPSRNNLSAAAHRGRLVPGRCRSWSRTGRARGRSATRRRCRAARAAPLASPTAARHCYSGEAADGPARRGWAAAW
jgi:hypothetical protein